MSTATIVIFVASEALAKKEVSSAISVPSVPGFYEFMSCWFPSAVRSVGQQLVETSQEPTCCQAYSIESVLLWTLSRTTAGLTKYVQGVGLLLLLWLVGGYLIFYVWYYVDMPTLSREERMPKIFGLFAPVTVLHLFNLYATRRFRVR
jgi:hypothetical protein